MSKMSSAFFFLSIENGRGEVGLPVAMIRRPFVSKWDESSRGWTCFG